MGTSKNCFLLLVMMVTLQQLNQLEEKLSVLLKCLETTNNTYESMLVYKEGYNGFCLSLCLSFLTPFRSVICRILMVGMINGHSKNYILVKFHWSCHLKFFQDIIIAS